MERVGRPRHLAAASLLLLVTACHNPMFTAIERLKSRAADINVRLQDVDVPNGGSYDFGSWVADGDGGSASAETACTIENLGEVDLTIAGVSVAGSDFDKTDAISSVVKPGESTTFTMRFDPLTSGSKITSVSITSNDTDEDPYAFSATGEGTVVPEPEITVRQGSVPLPDGTGSLDFGDLYADGNGAASSAELTITIENIGSADLTLSNVTFGGANPTDFDFVDSTTTPVSPGGATAFTIRFDPLELSLGNRSATVTILNNDTDEGTYTFGAAGTGVVNQTWAQQAELSQYIDLSNDRLGAAVSIDTNSAIVGAPYCSQNGVATGCAYTFDWAGGTWPQTNQLTGIDSEEDDYFGWSVSTCQHYFIVGAYGDDDKGDRSGSAYIFYENTETKLTASDGAPYDRFGHSVCTTGWDAIVGAIYDDDKGSAYIFNRVGSSWLQQAKLVASDSASLDEFGFSVGMSGNDAIAGAPYNDDSKGAAYIFHRTGSSWAQRAKLVAGDGAGGDRFGYAVSISGDYAVVGADRDDDKGADSGSVYVFHWDGSSWVQQAKLTASDGDAGDGFGEKVRVDGSIVFVAASGDGLDRGSAYRFFWNGISWQEETRLVAGDGADGDSFGSSLDVDGLYAIVGAYGDCDNGYQSGSAYIFLWSGSSWMQQAKLSDPVTANRFGQSTSVSGAYAVIGEPLDDEGGYDCGSAYVFWWNGSSWERQTKLTADDVQRGDGFGVSVCVSGDYAVVGSRNDDDRGDSSGSAYVLWRNGSSWIQQAKLTADDGVAGDLFGCSVSIAGDYAIVGASGDDGSRGSAYIFLRNASSWTQQARLTGEDGAAGDLFGCSVSIAGDYAIMGACGDDGSRGSAYVFLRNGSTWTQQEKLLASDGAAGDCFGFSVSASGSHAIVGAYGDDDKGPDSGSGYVFFWNGSSWGELAKLTAGDGASSDSFGYSVSIEGNYAIVGACNDDDKGTDSGSAYLFWWTGAGWMEVQKVTSVDGSAGDQFGCAVSISGSRAAVGAYLDDDQGRNSGSVYVFAY